MNLKKDLTIENLKMKLESSKKTQIMFTDFEASFDIDDMKTIRSVQPGPSRDSAFINKNFCALYKGSNRNKLFNRSATGRKHNGKKKECITPEKKEIIRKMFLERLSSEMENCDEQSEPELIGLEKRADKLNRHIRSAISNILTAFKKVSFPVLQTMQSNTNSAIERTSPTKVDSFQTIPSESITLSESMLISNSSSIHAAVEPASSNIDYYVQPLQPTKVSSLPSMPNESITLTDLMPFGNSSTSIQPISHIDNSHTHESFSQTIPPINYNWVQSYSETYDSSQQYWHPENQYGPHSYVYYGN